ncbi:hypothetical protein AX769_16350 [Frondihabitans sp. PAMC 28766]|uniref:PIN domain-containing protein n=1 Tax=Frondihabitans sp. PAMC 28766 TaxID=1795630 RepID=UPI00078BABD5|nr:PIN domain-containing protein [Frondihabitans sp. PAMC 28766]AMM21413.1 hypothetical protein AX769_16350 [Frondihabitans sp. PAMC 28766]
MILFDTSVLIAYDQLDIPAGDYVSSAVVLGELHFGVATAKSISMHSQRQARLARIRRTGIQWLPYTESTATFHAELMTAIHPHAPGKARARDIMIAATAYELGASLATLNPVDFRHIDALVEIVVPPRVA